MHRGVPSYYASIPSLFKAKSDSHATKEPRRISKSVAKTSAFGTHKDIQTHSMAVKAVLRSLKNDERTFCYLVLGNIVVRHNNSRPSQYLDSNVRRVRQNKMIDKLCAIIESKTKPNAEHTMGNALVVPLIERMGSRMLSIMDYTASVQEYAIA